MSGMLPSHDVHGVLAQQRDREVAAWSRARHHSRHAAARRTRQDGQPRLLFMLRRLVDAAGPLAGRHSQPGPRSSVHKHSG